MQTPAVPGPGETGEAHWAVSKRPGPERTQWKDQWTQHRWIQPQGKERRESKDTMMG